MKLFLLPPAADGIEFNLQRLLTQACELLKPAPVLQPILLRQAEELVRVSVRVKVARKAPFGSSKGDEVDWAACPGIGVPVFLKGHRGLIASQATPAAPPVALRPAPFEGCRSERGHSSL